jgi:glutaredoxin-dependent peroxiredoxin
MCVDVGTNAPDFTLPDQDRQPVTLAAQAGKHVVLAFFPAAFTSVCTKELCTFRDALAQLNEANATVFGISADGPWVLKEFATQQQLNFPLLSDFQRTTIESYGVANPEGPFRGIAKRAVFVIDGSGVVRHKEITANPGVEPDYARVHAVLATLVSGGAEEPQAVRDDEQ